MEWKMENVRKWYNIHGNNMLSIKVEQAYKCFVIDKIAMEGILKIFLSFF